MPPKGSLHDLILLEMVTRERSEKIARATLDARIQAIASGVPMEAVEPYIAEYALEVTHQAYLDDVLRGRIEQVLRKLRARREEYETHIRQVNRLDELSKLYEE